jgi:tRNA(adenine34) deaminase
VYAYRGFKSHPFRHFLTPDQRDEIGLNMDDTAAMRLALDEARRAAGHGDVPVGAVVVRDGVVIAAACNERELRNDPTAHAEVLALRAAAERVGSWRLANCTMYVTLEPCTMCAGAIINARVGTVVFGAADLKAGALGSLYNVAADPRLNHSPIVRHGVLEAEASEVLAEFFRTRRETS